MKYLKYIFLISLATFTFINCKTVRERAVVKCKETGADKVSVGSGSTTYFGVYTEHDSSQFDCKQLLKEDSIKKSK